MSRQIKDPISGSWVNIAGYNAVDNALDPNSRNPVQNKIVTEQFNAVNTKVGELSNLDTTDKSNIVAAINELKNAPIASNTMMRTAVGTINSGVSKTVNYEDGTIIVGTLNMDGLIIVAGRGFFSIGLSNMSVDSFDKTNKTITIRNTSNYSGDYVVYKPF